MKTHLLTTTSAAILAVFLCLALQAPATAALASDYPTVLFSDPFSTGTDANWTRLSAFAASSGQTWDASTFAYRMTAPANGFNPGTGKYGFVGSVVTGLPTFANGYVQSDVVAWQGNATFGAWAIGTRLGGINTILGMTGYAFAYEPYGNNGLGDVRLERLGPPSTFNSLGAVNITLTPGTSYTLTLETAGATIIGSIWNVGQLGGSPLATVTATDSTYATGYVGLFGVTQAPLPTIDVTFDNFIAAVPEPGTGLLVGAGLLAFFVSRRFGANRS